MEGMGRGQVAYTGEEWCRLPALYCYVGEEL